MGSKVNVTVTELRSRRRSFHSCSGADCASWFSFYWLNGRTRRRPTAGVHSTGSLVLQPRAPCDSVKTEKTARVGIAMAAFSPDDALLFHSSKVSPTYIKWVRTGVDVNCSSACLAEQSRLANWAAWETLIYQGKIFHIWKCSREICFHKFHWPFWWGTTPHLKGHSDPDSVELVREIKSLPNLAIKKHEPPGDNSFHVGEGSIRGLPLSDSPSLKQRGASQSRGWSNPTWGEPRPRNV